MTSTLAFVVAAMALLSPEGEHLEVAGAIARAVDAVPPLFGDADRRRTAALVVAIAWRESGFDNAVVSATDDHCFLQVHARPDLGRDVEACARVGLAMLRVSVRACAAHPVAFYASGPTGCANARAQRISRDRSAIAAWLLRRVP